MPKTVYHCSYCGQSFDDAEDGGYEECRAHEKLHPMDFELQILKALNYSNEGYMLPATLRVRWRQPEGELLEMQYELQATQIVGAKEVS